MKRAIVALLLLFSAWLVASPAARLPEAAAAETAASSPSAKTGAAVEHVAAQAATPQVARAPRLARAPIEPRSSSSAGAAFRLVPTPGAVCDLRQALRRVQTRRRIPRLAGGEPPWS